MESQNGNQQGWRSEWLPLSLVLFLSAAYFLCFFNRFAGLRSGDGEFGGGIAFLSGLRPYRDYFTAGPPLNVFKSALQLAIFGKMLVVSRLLAVCERLLIATTVYIWLRRLFTQQAAVLGTLLAIVVSAGDHTDPLASYNHDAIFLAILCGLLAAHSISIKYARRSALLAALAGLCGGLSLLTKQTVGGCAIAAVAICCLIATLKPYNMKRALQWLGAFSLGICVPVAATVLYLQQLGALKACLDMMFVSGPKAKASNPFVFLAREVMIAGLFRWWLLLAIALTILCAKALLRSVAQRPTSTRRSTSIWIAAGTCVLALILLALWTASHGAFTLQDTGKAAVYLFCSAPSSFA